MCGKKGANRHTGYRLGGGGREEGVKCKFESRQIAHRLPCLPQPLLNILQLPVYIRILPAEPRIKAFGYPCHPRRIVGNLAHLMDNSPRAHGNDGDDSEDKAGEDQDIQKGKDGENGGQGHGLRINILLLGQLNGLDLGVTVQPVKT